MMAEGSPRVACCRVATSFFSRKQPRLCSDSAGGSSWSGGPEALSAGEDYRGLSRYQGCAWPGASEGDCRCYDYLILTFKLELALAEAVFPSAIAHRACWVVQCQQERRAL